MKRCISVLRWVGRLSRPHTPTEVLTLVFALLSVATFAAVLLEVAGGHQSPFATVWVAALVLAAVVARLSPYWRGELEVMTKQRARSYLGSSLVVLLAIALSWHLLAAGLGMSDAYPLLGPASRPPYAIMVMVAVGIASVVLLLGIPVWSWIASLFRQTGQVAQRAREPRTIRFAQVDDLPSEDVGLESPADGAAATNPSPSTHPAPQITTPTDIACPANNGSMLPPIDLFQAPLKGSSARIDLEHVSQRIQETLASFNVAARVVGHHCGPVVTQFDVQPERGVKVKSITALQNDLALALAAPTIRIQAPVPGKPVVGIEIPNSTATVVTVRELLESEAYRSTKSPLRVPLGKDVAGSPQVIDLARMPHLLIAGATGSGKSACVNALISSLLYQNTPEQVRLMMVDPKVVELAVYNGVPHLLSPVVTQMDRVVGVLQWALREMERRYKLFAETTCRNILRFNEKAESLGLHRLPYLVLVVDELADLMMVAPDDVEDAICRLAQLARAAGIHLVIATQRPSVDVVTGLIKANFPARIAFAMTSQIDSRTILDSAGAEKLLGRGDMLYLPPDAPKPVRLQGAYVSDGEIERLVEFWQRSPLQSAIERVAQEEFVAAAKAVADEEDDLLGAAISVVREYQHASVSLLQRRLKIGYARAARVMDQLEARGVVGPADGGKQRPVLSEQA